MSALDFSGKVALVTGSSRGIGAGLVRALSRGGARCVVNYVNDPAGRNGAEAEQVAKEINAADIIECNVADHAAVAAMMRRVTEKLGGLDILINNAGILRDRSMKKMAPADFDDVMKVNLYGAFNCIQNAQPILRSGGRVINISSVAAFVGFFGQANYATSKAGIVALTKVAARELAKQQVTVNAIAPGFVRTEMTKDLGEDVIQKTMEQIPLGRWAEVDDVVNAAMLLCSEFASYVTGHTLHVNGGYYMD
jgi:3-oxoacyl-[acyl-carrier protein] reductase